MKEFRFIFASLLLLIFLGQSIVFAAPIKQSGEILIGDSIIKLIDGYDNVVILPKPGIDKESYDP